MAITLVGTFGGGIDTGSLTLTLPTGISFGDAVGAVVEGSTSVTLATPTGWTLRSGWPKDGGNARWWLFAKDSVTSSDSGASVVFTPSANTKLTGVGFVLHSGNGFPSDWTDALNFTAHTTTSSSYTAPSSTSAAAGDWGVAIFGSRGTGPFSDWTPASGLVERQDLTRSGGGATTLQLCDSGGSIGGTSTVWGPFTESNLSTSNGGALTWLVKENATGGGGGGGGGGGVLYPKCGLWADRDGVAWRTAMNAREAIYGPVQGHWGKYYGVGLLPVGSDVEQAFRDGKDIHIFWKPYDVSWADTAAGGYDTEIDAVAADVIALCSGTGRKLWLTLNHEPENDTTGSSGSFSYASFRGIWQQVRARFNTAGASQYVTWVAVFMNSHTNPGNNPTGPGQNMIDLWGNDGVMDGLVDIVSQQDYIAAGTTPSTIATKWLEDLEFLVTNKTASRNWSYLNKPQAFTEWGADLGGVVRGTNSHRAQTIDAIRGILPSLASRNVIEIRYFDARTDIIDDPPAVDGVAFQSLKDATEAGQQTPPVSVAGVALARDGATVTSSSIPFVLPTGWQQGDLAIVWLSTNSNPTMTTEPAGWVLEEGPVANSTVQVAWRYSKVLQAGELDPTWVISQGVRPSGIMVLLRGADGVTPEHAQASLTATSSGTSHAAAAVTTTAAQAFILTAWLFRWADASGNGGVNYGTPPGTHTTQATVSVNSGANPGAGALVASLNANPVAAGSYGSYTATVPVTSTGITGQVAFLPAGVAFARQVAETATGTDTLVVDTGAVPKTPADSGAASESLSVVASGAPAVGFPTQKVEVAFASQPMAASPIFTDITPYVRWPIERGYGRGDEFAEVAPGTIRLRLNNADGRFTMGKTGGAYYPNVKIGRRLRWSETFNGVNYVRFDGHVDAWPTAWITDSTAHAEAQITATDRLKRLGGIGELRSMLEEETLRDAPAVYYPLSEPDGATSAASVTTTPQPAALVAQLHGGGGLVEFGQGTGPGTDGLSAAVFTPVSQTSGKYLVASPVAVGSSTACSLSAWFNTSTTPTPNEAGLCALTTDAGDDALILAVWMTGQVQAFYRADGEGLFGNLSPSSYNDGHTHHAAVTLARSGSTVTVRLYVDGAQVQSGTFTRSVLPTFTRMEAGGARSDGTAAPFTGTLSHVAGYSTTLSATRVAAHYQAGTLGLAGERTDQRLGRVADWIALPSADRALDTGDKLMGAQATATKQPLEVMREVERVEQGILFVNGSGKLAFHRLSRRYNRTTPDLTLDGAAGQILVGIGFPGDDFGLVNDMTATRPGGGGGRAVNQASIDEYGLYRDSLEIPAASDNDAAAVGNWRVGNYGEPRTRLPNLTVPLARLKSSNPTLVAQVLSLEIGSLLRLTNLPSQAPASTLDVFVEGWTERLDRRTGEWAIELNCSPADFYTVAQLGLTATVTLPTARVAL